jgi:hypothetical protein
LRVFIASTFESRCESINGPFFCERIFLYRLPLRFTMNLSVRLLLRVL